MTKTRTMTSSTPMSVAATIAREASRLYERYERYERLQIGDNGLGGTSKKRQKGGSEGARSLINVSSGSYSDI